MTTSTTVSDLTRLFINDGRYLRAWSERTVETYERALNAFGSTPLTKAGLSAWVVTLRQRGLSVTTVNIMTRAVSSYLSWLHTEGHQSQRGHASTHDQKPLALF
jgi:site-specific recombinase XerD